MSTRMMNNEQSLAYADNRDGYGQSMNPTAAPQINNIEALESQIAMVKERIERNKRALVDMKGVTDRISNLEFKKINSTDPTSVWRWREQQKDMREANANIKSDEKARFRNKVDMWLDTDAADTKEGIDLQVANIRSDIVAGKNIGADVSLLEKKIVELKGGIKGKSTATDQLNAVVEGITSGKTLVDSEQIGELLNENLSAEQERDLKNKMEELKKKEGGAERNRIYMAGFKAYLKTNGVEYAKLDEQTKNNLRRSYDKFLRKQGGKK